MLQKIWESAKDILTTDEIKNKLLLLTDIYGCTDWHMATHEGVFQKMWDLAKHILTTEEMKNKLLLSKGYEGKKV
jgi:hypothetical protein